MIEKTLTGCFASYFGKKPGQNMADFAAEMRKATDNPKDRAEWCALFASAGYKVLDA